MEQVHLTLSKYRRFAAQLTSHVVGFLAKVFCISVLTDKLTRNFQHVEGKYFSSSVKERIIELQVPTYVTVHDRLYSHQRLNIAYGHFRQVIDLLNPGSNRTSLSVRWSKKTQSFFVENLFTVDCEQLDDLQAVLEEGNHGIPTTRRLYRVLIINYRAICFRY